MLLEEILGSNCELLL